MSAMGETIYSVAVGDLVLDDVYQVRTRLDQDAIRRYADAMRAGDEFPAIRVAMVQGVYVVVDGWHRVSAARLIGRLEFPTVLIEHKPHELAWLAVEANRAHGVPLGKGDRRRLLNAYVTANKHLGRGSKVKSSREMSKDLSGWISHTSIIKWMKEDHPSIWRLMSGAEPRAEGGLPDVDPEERRLAAIQEATREITANAPGVIDPVKRGEMLEGLKAMIQRLEHAMPWEPTLQADF